MISNQRRKQLRGKIPLIIILVIVLVFCLYLFVDVVEDVVVEGAPLTSEPWIGAILSLTRNITVVVSSWGYVGIFVLMLLESSSLPVPSEAILPFAGYFVSLGYLNFWLTIIVATIAGVAGSLIDYYIGLKGAHILAERKILGKAIFSMNQLETAAGWFNKHGPVVIFVGRLVPGFRTLISFPAGAAKMSLSKFVAFTTAGCLLWNSILIYLGYFLGVNWAEVAGFLHYIIIAVIVVAVILLAVYYVEIRRKKK